MSNRIKISLLVILLIPCWVVAWKFGQDMPAYYKVAKWLVDGRLDLIFAPDGELRWWYYCPAALILFEPMGWFSFMTAKVLWIVAHTVAYILFWVGLYRAYPMLGNRNCHWGWVVVFIIAINPLHTNFQAQNISLMLAAGLIWAELLTRSKTPKYRFIGGMLATVVASIKLFPFFVVLFAFLTKSKEVRRGIIAGFVLVAVAPLLYFGFSTGSQFYVDWVSNLTVYHEIYSLKINPENLSLPSLLSRWLSEWFQPAQVSLISKSVVAVIGLSFFAFVWKSRKRNDPGFQHHLWALAWALMALLNSSTRPDYFIFFVPAFASIVEIAQARSLKWVDWAGTIVAIFLIAFTTEWVLGSKELNNLVESWRIPAVGMVILCVVLQRLVRKTDFTRLASNNV